MIKALAKIEEQHKARAKMTAFLTLGRSRKILPRVPLDFTGEPEIVEGVVRASHLTLVPFI